MIQTTSCSYKLTKSPGFTVDSSPGISPNAMAIASCWLADELVFHHLFKMNKAVQAQMDAIPAKTSNINEAVRKAVAKEVAVADGAYFDFRASVVGFCRSRHIIQCSTRGQTLPTEFWEAPGRRCDNVGGGALPPTSAPISSSSSSSCCNLESWGFLHNDDDDDDDDDDWDPGGGGLRPIKKRTKSSSSSSSSSGGACDCHEKDENEEDRRADGDYGEFDSDWGLREEQSTRTAPRVLVRRRHVGGALC
jgi:hypothetical protein